MNGKILDFEKRLLETTMYLLCPRIRGSASSMGYVNRLVDVGLLFIESLFSYSFHDETSSVGHTDCLDRFAHPSLKEGITNYDKASVANKKIPVKLQQNISYLLPSALWPAHLLRRVALQRSCRTCEGYQQLPQRPVLPLPRRSVFLKRLESPADVQLQMRLYKLDECPAKMFFADNGLCIDHMDTPQLRRHTETYACLRGGKYFFGNHH